MADLERSTAAAPAPHTTTELEQLPSLFGRLGDDVMKLLDTKISLLKVELSEDISVYARGAAFIAVGGLVAAIGFALLNIALALGISAFMPTDWQQASRYAVGFVVTGILYLIVGGITIMVMKNRLARRDLVPGRSVEELRKDKEWLKKEM
ncbi:MAG TPA: phage holin family protein [Pyrinomonadaceae bacterium]